MSELMIKEKFAVQRLSIDQLSKTAKDLKVENELAIPIAEGLLKQIKGVVNAVEDAKKLYKQPYKAKMDEIEAYAKELTNDLLINDKRIRDDMKNVKELIIAQKRAEEDRKQKEIQAKALEKEEKANTLIRISLRLYSMLFGGSVTNKKGITNTFAPMDFSDKKNLNEFLDFINQNYPDIGKYVEFIDEHRKIKNSYVEAVKEINTLDTKSEEYEHSLSIIKHRLSIFHNDMSTEMGSSIDADIKTEKKIIANEMKTASKGIIEKPFYEIVDITKVPKQFIIINENAVSAFFVAERERVLADVKEGLGLELIPGLEIKIKTSLRIS